MNYSGLVTKITNLPVKPQVTIDTSKFSSLLIHLKKTAELFIIEMTDYAQDFSNNLKQFGTQSSQVRRNRRPSINFPNFSKLKDNKYFSKKTVVAGAIVLVLLLAGVGIVKTLGSREKSQVAGVTNVKEESANSIEINRLFEFPLSDQSTGEEVSSIKYEIAVAELLEEVYIQGQPARALEGRQFLVLSLKITNDYERNIEIYTRDYVRLKLDSTGEELLAADMHSDPMDVQAISTKYTRLGFNIPDDPGVIRLLVGEISGDKEEIQLSF